MQDPVVKIMLTLLRSNELESGWRQIQAICDGKKLIIWGLIRSMPTRKSWSVASEMVNSWACLSVANRANVMPPELIIKLINNTLRPLFKLDLFTIFKIKKFDLITVLELILSNSSVPRCSYECVDRFVRMENSFRHTGGSTRIHQPGQGFLIDFQLIFHFSCSKTCNCF